MSEPTIVFVLGTRPETIKLAPVVRACGERGWLTYVVHTGQHHAHALSDAFFDELDLPKPDAHLGIGSAPPAAQIRATLEALPPILSDVRPDFVAVQGDTTSAMAGALSAHHAGIEVVHVEAGLRCWDRRMPEEHNRALIDQLAEHLFAPTEVQRVNLVREGHGARCAVVGNTIADSLRWATERWAEDDPAVLSELGVDAGRFGWMTLHRQENVDAPETLRAILEGAETAAQEAGMPFVLPLHPRTRSRLDALGWTASDWIRTIAPVGYRACLAMVRHAAVVLTDSGGLQEEACILGVPCVTARASTERPETLHCGANRVAGVSSRGIAAAVAAARAAPRGWRHPYGSGDTAARMLDILGSASTAEAAGAEPPRELPQDGNASGRWTGEQELAYLGEVIRSGTLNSTKGTMVDRFESAFAKRLGARHGIACASGSAAVHCAVAAIGLQPGDEVVTTPITDMGALTPILYEGGVPVFADVDKDTLNVTAETLRAQLTDRTRALIVTHLFGLPCRMEPILELARERDLVVIEDCAQAFLAEDSAGPVGRLGHVACYSMQQGKHMTTGEGGVVITDDDDLARRATLFVNKAWGYGDPKPDHYFPALNYRLTELQGAVALAQLEKLDWVVDRRRHVACQLHGALADLPGVALPEAAPGQKHVFWKYALRIDPSSIAGGAVGLGSALREQGIFCAPRYIAKPAFECALFQDWNASPVSAMPLAHNPRRNGPMPPFVRADYPGAVEGLEQVLVLPINEFYTPEHVAHVSRHVREQARALHHGS